MIKIELHPVIFVCLVSTPVLITALHSGAQNTDSVAIDCSHYFGLLDAGMCLDP